MEVASGFVKESLFGGALFFISTYTYNIYIYVYICIYIYIYTHRVLGLGLKDLGLERKIDEYETRWGAGFGFRIGPSRHKTGIGGGGAFQEVFGV